MDLKSLKKSKKKIKKLIKGVMGNRLCPCKHCTNLKDVYSCAVWKSHNCRSGRFTGLRYSVLTNLRTLNNIIENHIENWDSYTE